MIFDLILADYETKNAIAVRDADVDAAVAKDKARFGSEAKWQRYVASLTGGESALRKLKKSTLRFDRILDHAVPGAGLLSGDLMLREAAMDKLHSGAHVDVFLPLPDYVHKVEGETL